jgi:ribosomal protein S18 acetylase RimI-like enzyme
MTSSVLPREWDSTFFGARIFEAHVRGDPLEGVVAQAKGAGAECVYLFMDADDLRGIEEAVRAGARLVDLRTELGGSVKVDLAARATRSATRADRETLLSHARELAIESRFSRDPRIPEEKVRNMYEIWLDRCLDEGVVAVPTTGRAGFVGAREDDSVARIELVYIDPASRGHGVGRALVREAVASLATSDATVVTQIGNLAAQRLYESLGLRSRSTSAVLHLWLDERSA